jgi:hypothetical protein
MTGVKRTTNGSDRGYYLSARLVNKLIFSIFSGIIIIAGYMIVWAVNDGRWKSAQEVKLETFAGSQALHRQQHPDVTGSFASRITVLETNQQAILQNQRRILDRLDADVRD